jgi:hypothetical protein
MNYYFNLLGNLGPSSCDDHEEEDEVEIVTQVWCGCGSHKIDPGKDVYRQHNQWIEEEFGRGVKIESGGTSLENIKNLYVAPRRKRPSYDFSGEEFEITNEEMRKFKK